MFNMLHGWSRTFWKSLWSAGILKNREPDQYHGNNSEIRFALMSMHQEWRQKEIMDEEQQEIDRELPPYDEHLRPVEHDTGIIDRPHIQTQQRGGKKQTPHYQVDQILLS